MWAILKFDKKNLEILKKDFYKKLGSDVKFYNPKLELKKTKKKKTFIKEISLLNDYLLCFHKDFSKKSVLTSLKYCRGLKYFLSDFLSSQKEIEKFIIKCKKNETSTGYILPSFFDYKKNESYEFISGPFTNFIFNIFKENKLSMYGVMGNYKITVSKNNYFFRSV